MASNNAAAVGFPQVSALPSAAATPYRAVGYNGQLYFSTGSLWLPLNGIPWCPAGGTADALTLTYDPALAGYTDAMPLRARIGASPNATTTPTGNVNGLGALTIKKRGGAALAIGDLAATMEALFVVRDEFGTQWLELLNPASAGGAGNFTVGAAFTSTVAIDVTSAQPVERPMRVAGTIVGVTIIGNDQGGAGSCVVDVEKASYAGYPTFASIAAAAKPTIAAGYKNTDTTLTGWTTAVAAGDVLRFVLESSSVFKRITILLEIQP